MTSRNWNKWDRLPGGTYVFSLQTKSPWGKPARVNRWVGIRVCSHCRFYDQVVERTDTGEKWRLCFCNADTALEPFDFIVAP